jgi:hypothetical protein
VLPGGCIFQEIIFLALVQPAQKLAKLAVVSGGESQIRLLTLVVMMSTKAVGADATDHQRCAGWAQ